MFGEPFPGTAGAVSTGWGASAAPTKPQLGTDPGKDFTKPDAENVTSPSSAGQKGPSGGCRHRVCAVLWQRGGCPGCSPGTRGHWWLSPTPVTVPSLCGLGQPRVLGGVQGAPRGAREHQSCLLSVLSNPKAA